MIRGAFAHFPGIGPHRLRRLQQAGVQDWRILLEDPKVAGLGAVGQARLREAVESCEQAVQCDDIAFLVDRFKQQDRWRILGTFFARATFFDIETSGLDRDSDVTLVSCLHRDRLYSFLRGQSLDRFLEVLDDVDLLVSFNGTSFDVPRIEDAFHIPACPCPHLDLRWLCYHASMSGGLKAIETEIGIERPADLRSIDGEQACWLWGMWEQDGDAKARHVLERYCGADVLTLKLVAAHLLEANGCKVSCESAALLWSKLDPEVRTSEPFAPPTVEPEGESRTGVTPLERRLRSSWQRRRAGSSQAT